MRVLTLPLKGEYFDQIKDGVKKEEYRKCSAFWMKRLWLKSFDKIVLTRGYPKKTDTTRRLELPWRGCTIKKITHPHFGSEPVNVFAIRLSETLLTKENTP